MIRPKELSLGNVVRYKGRIREVLTINYNWLNLNGPLPVGLEHCEGVPITYGLLRKAGFEEISEGEFYKAVNGHIEVFVYKDSDTEYRIGKTDADIHIKYMHELQNAYYLLTKIPLTLDV